MKLLSPVEQKDARQTEITKQLLRAQETEEIVKKNNIALAKSEADFNSTLARNRAKWALEEEEHEKRIKDMSEEIQTLEIRKQQALIPIEIYQKKADDLYRNAEEKYQQATLKEKKADETLEILEEKMSEVGDRENMVVNEENSQKIAREGIKYQQNLVKIENDKLTQLITEFHVKQQKEDEKLLKRKREIEMAEINIQAKIDKIKMNTEALRIERIQLDDLRATLERAIQNT